MTILLLALIACGIYGLLAWLSLDTRLVKIKKGQVIDFSSSFDLTGLPIVTFYQDTKKYHFLFDSGSNASYVNSKSSIMLDEVKGVDTYMGADGVDRECSIYNTTLYYKDRAYVCEVKVADLSLAFNNLKNYYGIEISGIVGGDFFKRYKYCLDYKDMIVYERK